MDCEAVCLVRQVRPETVREKQMTEMWGETFLYDKQMCVCVVGVHVYTCVCVYTCA